MSYVSGLIHTTDVVAPSVRLLVVTVTLPVHHISKKLCQYYFFSSSAKHRLISIIFWHSTSRRNLK